MSHATGLDHVGIVVGDLPAATRAWEALGFAPTEVAHHHAPGSDGTMRPTGTGNVCLMLAEGYLELIAVVDPARPSATIARLLARHEGGHILSLTVADADAAAGRLERAGFDTAVTASARPAGRGGLQAQFRRLPLIEADPRLQLLQHLTPELVWQPQFLRHPNRAVALRAVVLVAGEPAAAAARLSRAAGVAVLPDPLAGYLLRMDKGDVRIIPPAALPRVFAGVSIPCLPYLAGIVLATDDGNEAVASLPGLRPVAGGHLGDATGLAVLFQPG